MVDTVRGRPYSFQDPASGQNIILIDTPGFDDTSRSDAEILRELSYALAVLHLRNVRLAGLIYLHRITDPRMTGSAKKNLRLFKSLCGERNYPRAVLATTMWTGDEIQEERSVGRKREQQLRETYWADMIRGGSEVKRHDGSRNSAIDMVRILTGGGPEEVVVTLAIQQELVVEGRPLSDTEAGRILAQEIDMERERAARTVSDLNSEMEEAEREDDRGAAAALRAEREEAKARAARRARDRDGLGVSFTQLAEQQRPLYTAVLLEERQRRRRKARQHSSQSSTSYGSSISDTDTATTQKPRRMGIVRRRGRISGAQGKRGSVKIPDRKSSLGKTDLASQLVMYWAT